MRQRRHYRIREETAVPEIRDEDMIEFVIEKAQLDEAHAEKLREYYRDMISVASIKARRKTQEEDDGERIRRPAGLPAK